MTYAILLAGGNGERMGGSVSKALLSLGGLPAVVRCARVLSSCTDGIILVTRPQDTEVIHKTLLEHGLRDSLYAPAGEDRQASVRSALAFLPSACETVLIHDCARALVTESIVKRVLDATLHHDAAIASFPVTDTLKETEDGKTIHFIARSDRTRYRAAQTPQGFSTKLLLRAHDNAEALGVRGTDDAELVTLLGVPVQLVTGSRENIKLTVPEDLRMARGILSARETPFNAIRIGHGYDVHRLVNGRPLVLGGVTIPHPFGLLGHSDADAALHALMDAMLGAAGLGDIGHHFPDSDTTYEGISSSQLLTTVNRLLGEQGWKLLNADITIVAEQPKLAPYIPEMRRNISYLLSVLYHDVNVKATTTETLGFEGACAGISATAVCTITYLKEKEMTE